MTDIDFADLRGSLHRHDLFGRAVNTPWYEHAVYDRFSDSEYRRRWSATQEKMSRLGLDVLVAPGGPNHWSWGGPVRWLTNHWEWHGVAAYAVVPPEGEPVLVCGPGGAHREAVRRLSPVSDVRQSRWGRYGEVIAEVIRERGLEGGRIGHSLVDPVYETSMPANDLEALTSGVGGEVVSVGDFFHELVHVKSPEEQEAVRRAGTIMDQAMHAMVAAARPGVTEYELAAEVTHAVMRAGGQIDFTIIGSTPVESPALVFGNPWPSSRPLERGDIIVNELACGYLGYSVQLGTPICVGPPPGWVEDFHRDVLDGFDAMAAELRPGRTWEDVRKAGDLYAERGYDSRPLHLHCIDFVSHEPHVLVEGVRAEEQDRDIVPGVEAMLEPTVINQEGTFGIFYGRTFLITEGGNEAVTRFPSELVVV